MFNIISLLLETILQLPPGSLYVLIAISLLDLFVRGIIFKVFEQRVNVLRSLIALVVG